jgi:predicted nucleotidyltransferase
LASLALRDRDAITTAEGLIFRVFGYTHPPDAYICDLEYAPAKIFKSNDPRAFRTDGENVYYKFYGDEAWSFIANNFPQYEFLHPILQKKVVGVNRRYISAFRRPQEELERLVERESKDRLLTAMQNVLGIALRHSGLSRRDFGVFGSLLHRFYHPRFSDIDFVMYGKSNVARIRETLESLFAETNSTLRNEFENDESVKGKTWRFLNLTSEQFVWHQQRKMIYALFDDKEGGRTIKVEFEPVKGWEDLTNEFDPRMRVLQRGWVKMFARVTGDGDAPFTPSVYEVEPMSILSGDKNANEAMRVVSFMEEFRRQAFRDEKVYIEGNLEQVVTPRGEFYQVALTRCPRYYEQVLKVVS